MTLLVVTFVMCAAAAFKVTDIVPWKTLSRMVWYELPRTLTFSIPVSVLTACLLVFGRISADGEITAMKSCGVSLWRIAYLPLMVALTCSLLCLYVNDELSPKGHLARRQLMNSMGVETAIDIIEEGRFIQEFEGYTIFIGRKNKNNELHNIRIVDSSKNTRQEIKASRGALQESPDKKNLIIKLYDVRIVTVASDFPGTMYMEESEVEIPIASRSRTYRPKEKDKTFRRLWWELNNIRDAYPGLAKDDFAKQRSAVRVEIHKRLVLSASCLAFAMLGIPLGISAHRKESSIGIGLSLLLVANFYLFIVVAESLDKHPEWYPHLITWCPVLISMSLGAFLIQRNN
jgi:lipopolysaccharide export system permease protein